LAQIRPSFPKIIFNGVDIFFIARCDFPSHQCRSMKIFCTNISPYKMFFHNETPYVVDKIFFLSDILLEKNILFSYTLVKKIFFSTDTPLRKNIFHRCIVEENIFLHGYTVDEIFCCIYIIKENNFSHRYIDNNKYFSTDVPLRNFFFLVDTSPRFFFLKNTSPHH